MAIVASLFVLNQSPPWQQRLESSAFRQPPWHALHPARSIIADERPQDSMLLARLVDAFVDRLSLQSLVASFAGRGSTPHRPDLMLKAVLFLIQRRLHSPAAWYRQACENRVVQWLLRGCRPSRARWFAFRQRCQRCLASLNQQLLQMAKQLGLLQPDVAILDGTFLAANSSRHVLINQPKLQARLQLLQQIMAADEAAGLPPQAGAPPAERPDELTEQTQRRQDRTADQTQACVTASTVVPVPPTAAPPSTPASSQSPATPTTSTPPATTATQPAATGTVAGSATDQHEQPRPYRFWHAQTPTCLASHSEPGMQAPTWITMVGTVVAAVPASDTATPPVAQQPPTAGTVAVAVAASDTLTPPVAVVASVPSKLPGWLAKTPGGRQRQYQRYQTAALELDKRLLANSKRRKRDRKDSTQVRLSLGDSAATLGLDKEKVYRPLYNAQVVCDLRTDFCLSYEVFSGVQDVDTLKAMLSRTREMVGEKIKTVMNDGGYVSGANLRFLEGEGIVMVAPMPENDGVQNKQSRKGSRQLPKSAFAWNEEKGTYRCPEGRELSYVGSETKKRGEVEQKYARYRCPAEYCQACSRQGECTKSRSGRVVVRNEYEKENERQKERMSSVAWQSLYKKRKEQIERRFADSKEHRGLRKLSMRGQEGGRTQLGLTVLVSNMTIFAKLENRLYQAKTVPPMAG